MFSLISCNLLYFLEASERCPVHHYQDLLLFRTFDNLDLWHFFVHRFVHTIEFGLRPPSIPVPVTKTLTVLEGLTLLNSAEKSIIHTFLHFRIQIIT